MLVFLACCGSDRPQRPVPPAPPASTEPTEPTEPTESASLPTEANDDLPHRQAEAARLFAGATDCVPSRDGPDRDPITLALDVIGDDLVACAQLLTRRSVSVFADPVSFTCWTIDPATGHLTRRADLGRSYFRCQDGLCPPESRAFISHDGTARAELGDSAISIIERRADGTAGKTLASFPAPLDVDLVGAEVTYLGHALALLLESSVVIVDDRGKTRARMPGRPTEIAIVSPAELLLVASPVRATLYNVAKHTSTAIVRSGCSDPEVQDEEMRTDRCKRAIATPITPGVRRRGALFGLDDEHRRLIELDGAFRAQRTRSLAVCR